MIKFGKSKVTAMNLHCCCRKFLNPSKKQWVTGSKVTVLTEYLRKIQLHKNNKTNVSTSTLSYWSLAIYWLTALQNSLREMQNQLEETCHQNRKLQESNDDEVERCRVLNSTLDKLRLELNQTKEEAEEYKTKVIIFRWTFYMLCGLSLERPGKIKTKWGFGHNSVSLELVGRALGKCPVRLP